jgi:bifunctional non-homologous end joining protein LigD
VDARGRRRPASTQLDLPLADAAAVSPPSLPARLAFAIASDGGRPFDDESRFFEPWWPGAPAFLRRSGRSIELRTAHLSDPLIAFPELASVVSGLKGDEIVIEGTLLALDEHGIPDERLLRHRLAGRPSAIAEGAFVAADLVYLAGESLARRPFVERRRRLSGILRDGPHHVLSRGLVGEGRTLAHAVAGLGLSAISARRLDAPWRPGPAGDAWLRLPVGETPATPARPLLVLLERLPLEG